jgi:hypothetical protein
VSFGLEQKIMEQLVILSVLTLGIDDKRLEECWRKFDSWRTKNTLKSRQRLLKALTGFEKVVRLQEITATRSKPLRFKSLTKIKKRLSDTAVS